jgi:NAD(P)-dependent dehydrogenase (short-subunit alcohol dehydrogenase family)
MQSRPHSGKVALVTGGAMGIGRAIAVRLGQDGAAVVIADREPADETSAEIAALDGRVLSVRCDVSAPDEIEKLSRAVAAAFQRCDILVNNVGVFATRPFDQITFEIWKQTFSINLDSMFLTTKAFLGGMQARGWGRIINLASNTFGSAVPHHVDYIASKGGVVGFTRGLASEVGVDGVTVNAVAPGLTRTPGAARPGFQPRGTTLAEAQRLIAAAQSIKRPQEPSDLAGVVSFLASDDAGFMSGQTLYVDGGLVRV